MDKWKIIQQAPDLKSSILCFCECFYISLFRFISFKFNILPWKIIASFFFKKLFIKRFYILLILTSYRKPSVTLWSKYTPETILFVYILFLVLWHMSAAYYPLPWLDKNTNINQLKKRRYFYCDGSFGIKILR